MGKHAVPVIKYYAASPAHNLASGFIQTMQATCVIN